MKPFNLSKSDAPVQKSNQVGFTLVELLVCIVIIGILTVLAFGTVGAVRKRAAKLGCANNLRCVGVAINLYTNENQGYLPGPVYVNIAHTASYNYLTKQDKNLSLACYLIGYLIPGTPTGALKSEIQVPALMCPSYKYKANATADELTNNYKRPLDTVLPFGNDDNSGNPVLPKKLVSLPMLYNLPLSRIWAIVVADRALQDGGANYLYFDGHVQWVRSGVDARNP